MARIPVLNRGRHPANDQRSHPDHADGEPIIGLSPELDNFYLCCGFTSGIAASGGAGWVMANWIVDGDPGMDLWPFDVRRFGAPHAVKRFMYERAVESYGRYYHIAWPNYEPEVGRNARRSPLARQAARKRRRVRQQVRMGASELVRARRDAAVDTPSFDRGAAFDAIGAEHRAVRERVALIDMSSFSKYEVRRPRRIGAAATARRQQPRPAGRHHRLHAAVQRARRHRGRRHDHAPRPRPLLFRHRQRAGRPRPLDDRAPLARRWQRQDRGPHVGAGGAQRLRAARARCAWRN